MRVTVKIDMRKSNVTDFCKYTFNNGSTLCLWRHYRYECGYFYVGGTWI